MDIRLAATRMVRVMGMDNGVLWHPTDDQWTELTKSLEAFAKEYKEKGFGELDDSLCEAIGLGFLYISGDPNVDHKMPHIYDEEVGAHMPWKGAQCQTWPALDEALNDIFDTEAFLQAGWICNAELDVHPDLRKKGN